MMMKIHAEQPLCGEPGGLSAEYGVCVDEELSGAGDERELVGFSGLRRL